MKSTVIYTNLKEIVEPAHTALVVWDVQNGLVSSIYNREEFLKYLRMILDAARANGIPILYTKITPLPTGYESPWRLYTQMKRAGLDDPAELKPFMVPGSEQAEIHSDVAPLDNDVVLNKYTTSVFIGTSFELLMRTANIETIIFTGISTDVGVASSARDSSSRGFFTVVVEDCVSSPREELHKAALMALRSVCVVESSGDILREWK